MSCPPNKTSTFQQQQRLIAQQFRQFIILIHLHAHTQTHTTSTSPVTSQQPVHSAIVHCRQCPCRLTVACWVWQCVPLCVVMCGKDGTVCKRSPQSVQHRALPRSTYAAVPFCWPVILQRVSSPANRDTKRQMDRERMPRLQAFRRATPSMPSSNTTSSFQNYPAHGAVNPPKRHRPL